MQMSILDQNSDFYPSGLFKKVLKVSKSQKQFMVSLILPKKERNSLCILSKGDTQNSEFHLFFGRIGETIKLLLRFTDLY